MPKIATLNLFDKVIAPLTGTTVNPANFETKTVRY